MESKSIHLIHSNFQNDIRLFSRLSFYFIYFIMHKTIKTACKSKLDKIIIFIVVNKLYY